MIKVDTLILGGGISGIFIGIEFLHKGLHDFLTCQFRGACPACLPPVAWKNGHGQAVRAQCIPVSLPLRYASEVPEGHLWQA